MCSKRTLELFSVHEISPSPSRCPADSIRLASREVESPGQTVSRQHSSNGRIHISVLRILLKINSHSPCGVSWAAKTLASEPDASPIGVLSWCPALWHPRLGAHAHRPCLASANVQGGFDPAPAAPKHSPSGSQHHFHL